MHRMVCSQVLEQRRGVTFSRYIKIESVDEEWWSQCDL